MAGRGEQVFDGIFEALVPGNKLWAGAASALIAVVADTRAPDGQPNPYALYDTGQAVANLVAQAVHEGLAVHQMAGFDKSAVASTFGLPEHLQPVVVVAVGQQDASAPLTDALAEREVAPRVRRPLEELVLSQPVSL